MGSTDSERLQALLVILKAAGVSTYKTPELEIHFEAGPRPSGLKLAPLPPLAEEQVVPLAADPYHELFGGAMPSLKRAK